MLRTERQLGYVVQCGIRSIGKSQGLSTHIQSAVMGPRDLESEIESWWRGFEARPTFFIGQMGHLDFVQQSRLFHN